MFERYQDPREILLHKMEAGVNREAKFGPISLDLQNRTAWVDEQSIKLSPSEYQTLWILVRAQGGIINVVEIERFLYEERGEDEDLPLTNPVQQFVSSVREKLEKLSGNTVTISNKKGQGYSLELLNENIANSKSSD